MTDLQLSHQAQREALEGRFARRLTAALDEQGVGHDIEQRLRFAREQATSRLRNAQLAATAVTVIQGRDGTATLGTTPWWLRLASFAPLLVLAAGLLLIDRLNSAEQIHAAAEVDAVLLADELPPSAYSDPGFGEFLKRPIP